MTDVEGFLLARIVEDEAAIERHAVAIDAAFGLGDGGLRRRLFAECAAKRLILAEHQPYPTEGIKACNGCENYDPTGLNSHDEPWPCLHWRILALPYAYHPDYNPDWRP